MGLLVSIDNGGTLTDVCAFDGTRIFHAKTLTTPHDLTECLMAGLQALSTKIDGGADPQRFITSIDHLRYSTTVGTNAIVQRKGPRLGLMLSNSAQEQALRAAAPDLFEGFIGARVAYFDGANEQQVVQAVRGLVAQGASRLVICLDGHAPEDESNLRRRLYKSFPRHLLGAVPLTFSTELAPGADAVRRGWTCIINAFLHPSMEQFLYNAEEKLRRHHIRNPLLVFRNDGGSTRVSRTIAINTYSSGPRGGAEGAAVLARHYGFARTASIDIGGTTTDIALLENNVIVENLLGQVEEAPIAFPMTDVSSIAAGGGSVLRVADGEITVGPDSTGSLPGPACFGRGGTSATITDAILVAGLFDPDSFFGGKLRLDRARAEKAITDNIAAPLGISCDAAVKAVIDAYDSKIADAIGIAAKGAGVPTLIAFGGAGPMSACGIAEKARIPQILIPRFAAVFSAFGIGFSPIRHNHAMHVESFARQATEVACAALRERAARAMTNEGFDLAECELTWDAVVGTGADAVVHALHDAPLHAAGILRLEVVRKIPIPTLGPARVEDVAEVKPSAERQSMRGMPVFRLEDLAPGNYGAGPCLVEEEFFTTWVRQGWRFTVTANHDLLLRRQGG